MMRRGIGWLVLALASALIAACAPTPVASVSTTDRTEIEARLRADIAVLASDDFGGRKPGTPGEEKTLAFIETRMTELGLVSGTGDPGSYWRMPVELVSTKPQSSQITLGKGQ